MVFATMRFRGGGALQNRQSKRSYFFIVGAPRGMKGFISFSKPELDKSCQLHDSERDTTCFFSIHVKQRFIPKPNFSLHAHYFV